MNARSAVADLHVHTTATDGRETVAQVLRGAAAAGLTHLVFTDHSALTWDGVAEAAAGHGISTPFPGMEVSTVLDGARYHITLYGRGLLDARLRAFLARPNDHKTRLAESTRAALVADGYDLPPLAVLRAESAVDTEGNFQPTPETVLVSRTTIARHLAHRSTLDLDRAYRLVAAAHLAAETAEPPADRYLPTLDVLAAARAAGLFAALAHPLWRCHSDSDVRRVVADLAVLCDHGLRGVETRSYHHRPLDDHPLLLAARSDLGLLRSGGSDYHANGRTTLGVGGLDRDEYSAVADAVDREVPA